MSIPIGSVGYCASENTDRCNITLISSGEALDFGELSRAAALGVISIDSIFATISHAAMLCKNLTNPGYDPFKIISCEIISAA